MPTELEELVEFLHHGNTQIRQIACENLVGYSSNGSIFKKPQFVPIKDLKLLVRDYAPIAKNALTILINLTSHDEEILKDLAEDTTFVTVLLKKVTDDKDPTAHLTSQLLANLSKLPSLGDRLLTLELPIPPSATGPRSPLAINQLLDLFVTAAAAASSSSSTTTKQLSTTPSNAEAEADAGAHFDYLSYLLADLSASHASIRSYFLTAQDYDKVIPLSKIAVFTEHGSAIRRKGVASTIKNVSFDIDRHDVLLDDDQVNILPYLLLPLAGSEEFSSDEVDTLLPDLQLLPPDKQREPDVDVVVTHVETLTLLGTTRRGRERMRDGGVYAVVRVLHEVVADDAVREACERLVNVLMRDEPEPEPEPEHEGENVEDREVEEVF